MGMKKVISFRMAAMALNDGFRILNSPPVYLE
jgi:hypothetical protein